MTNQTDSKEKLIYPELSYKIIGLAYEIYNKLGYDQQERYYSRAFAEAFNREGIKYEREKSVGLFFNGKCIGKYILDFLVADKLILELKKMPRVSLLRFPLSQPLEYLNVLKLKLAILLFFTREGVKYKRVVNPRIKL